MTPTIGTSALCEEQEQEQEQEQGGGRVQPVHSVLAVGQ